MRGKPKGRAILPGWYLDRQETRKARKQENRRIRTIEKRIWAKDITTKEET